MIRKIPTTCFSTHSGWRCQCSGFVWIDIWMWIGETRTSSFHRMQAAWLGPISWKCCWRFCLPQGGSSPDGRLRLFWPVQCFSRPDSVLQYRHNFCSESKRVCSYGRTDWRQWSHHLCSLLREELLFHPIARYYTPTQRVGLLYERCGIWFNDSVGNRVSVSSKTESDVYFQHCTASTHQGIWKILLTPRTARTQPKQTTINPVAQRVYLMNFTLNVFKGWRFVIIIL